MKKQQKWLEKNRMLVLAVCCLAVLVIAGAVIGMSPFNPEESGYPLYFEGEETEFTAYHIHGNIYIPAEAAEAYGNTAGMTIDRTAEEIRMDLSTKNIDMADRATTNLVKTYAGTVSIPARTIHGECCVPVNTLGSFFHLQAEVKGKKIKMNPFDARNGDKNTVDYYAPAKEKYVQGKEKISVVWQYVKSLTEPAPEKKNDGIDVLCPTWFHLTVEGGGAVENHGDLGYTQTAHENGYMVWATITNNMATKGSTNFTAKCFANTDLLYRSVAQYIFLATLYAVDGINIDYEDVRDSDAKGLTAFTSLLRNYTERQGLNLSIDTLIPAEWTVEYDRASLAEYVDYIAVMTYDEHYAGSKEAGSIASLPWVEEAVKACLKDVPAEKLLLGVPLYTRQWVTDENGRVLKQTALTMNSAADLVKKQNLTAEWKADVKQNYVSWKEDGNLNQIWLEDERSVANRLRLVQKYDLAGSASWQRSLASEDIWKVYGHMLKDDGKVSDYEPEK